MACRGFLDAGFDRGSVDSEWEIICLIQIKTFMSLQPFLGQFHGNIVTSNTIGMTSFRHNTLKIHLH